MKKIQQKFTPKEEGTMATKQSYTKKINKQKITPMEERKVKRNR